MEKKMTELTDEAMREMDRKIGNAVNPELEAIKLLSDLGAAVSASPQPRCPKCGGADFDDAGLYENADGDSSGEVVCKSCNSRYTPEELINASPYAAPQCFYVIERFENGKSLGYWNGNSSRDFDTNIEQAIQFRRKEDAQHIRRGWHWKDTQVTEHLYIPGAFFAPAPVQEPPKGTCPCSKDHGPHEGKLINISRHGLNLTVCEKHEPLYRPLPPIDAMAEYRAAQPVENSSRCGKIMAHKLGNQKCGGNRDHELHTDKSSIFYHEFEAEPISGGASTGEQPPHVPIMTMREIIEAEGPSAPKVEPLDFDMEFARKVKVIGERFNWDIQAFFEHVQAEQTQPTQATEAASAPQTEWHCQECREPIKFNGRQWLHADGTPTYPRCTRPKPAAPSVAGTQPEPIRCSQCKSPLCECIATKLLAQGMPQVEEISRAIQWEWTNGDSVTVEDAAKKVLAKHLPGAPAQLGPDFLTRLRCIGGKLRMNLKDAATLNPEHFNQNGINQLIAEWDEVVSDVVKEMCVPSPAQGTPEPPNVYQLFKHKAGCLWNSALPTGEGTFGCTCGLDKLLLDLEDFEIDPKVALAGPQNGQGWVATKDSLPDDDSEVYAAIAWTHSPGVRKYVIHDCSYYEGGTGSGQKIFVDCEGEEFEAHEVDYWIYKHRLAEQLPEPLPAPPTGDAPHKEKP